MRFGGNLSVIYHNLGKRFSSPNLLNEKPPYKFKILCSRIRNTIICIVRFVKLTL